MFIAFPTFQTAAASKIAENLEETFPNENFGKGELPLLVQVLLPLRCLSRRQESKGKKKSSADSPSSRAALPDPMQKHGVNLNHVEISRSSDFLVCFVLFCFRYPDHKSNLTEFICSLLSGTAQPRWFLYALLLGISRIWKFGNFRFCLHPLYSTHIQFPNLSFQYTTET